MPDTEELFLFQFLKDVFSMPEILTSEKLIELYNTYLDEIEEENNKRKQEDEEYEKRKQKLVSGTL